MIFFLFGPDTYRSKEKLKALKQKFISSVKSAQDSLVVLDGKSTNLQELNEKIKAESLFSNKKMIIIEDLLQNSNQTLLGDFLQYLKDNRLADSEDAIIFIEEDLNSGKLKENTKKLFTWLQKQKYSQEFKLLNNAQLKQWVQSELNKHKQNITRPALEELILRTNNDLWQLSQEIHKLQHYQPRTEIGLEQIKDLTSGHVEENIFALTDALGRKNFALAAKLLNEQLQTEFSPEYILSMVKRQFQLILQAKIYQDQGKNPNTIAKELGWHPFVAQKCAAQARQFTVNDLKYSLNQLNHIDYLSKQGQADIAIWLDLFIAQAMSKTKN